MFVICANGVNRRGELVGPWQVRNGFTRKEDAAKFLSGMISVRPAKTAGYDSERDFWWMQIGDVVTRYSIAPCR